MNTTTLILIYICTLSDCEANMLAWMPQNIPLRGNYIGYVAGLTTCINVLNQHKVSSPSQGLEFLSLKI